MKKIYVMMVITVLFFLLSSGVFFDSNVYISVALVIIYLMLVAQLVLRLDTSLKDFQDTYVLSENRISYFTPMIFMPFLGLTYSFGLISFIVNILLIVLLYVYVIFVSKRNELTVTERGFSVVYLNNKKASMLFSEVETIEFNWVYNYIGLLNSKGEKLILDITLKDYIVVLKAIKANIPKEMSAVAFKHLGRYYKAFLVKSNFKYLK